MESLRELQGWHIAGRSLWLDGGWEGSVTLTPALEGVVEVRLHRGTPWSREAPAPSLSVDPAAWPELDPPAVTDQDDYLLAKFPGVTVRIDKAPIRLSFLVDGAADPLLEEHPAGGLWMDGWRVAARWQLAAGDQFFGLGEPDQRQGPIPFNHRGRKYPLWNKHLPAPSRLVLPVLVSHKGYGLFVDNGWEAEWDLGSDGGTFSFTAQGGQLTYYFIAGPALTTVLDRCTALTGRPALAPKWSFGLLQSKYGYKTRTEVEELVETFRAKGIPLDCVILDLYWFKHMGDLAFDRAAFPDPAGMLAALKAQGVRMITIEEPYVVKGSRLYPEAERLGLLGRRTDGSAYTFPFWAGEAGLVDFTQPLARQWWADQHKPLMDLGIAGWWTDLNEPEEHPQAMIFAGGTAQATHNTYALQMIRSLALAQEQHNPQGRLFILSRSGWPGSQALGAGQWSGDVATRWDALANQIPLGLSMAMAGMAYWNTDIGGFTGEKPMPELYVRWVQFGAFTPIMRPHGAHQNREPWAFGDEVERIAADYIRLRYRLLPYTYTLAREAATVGLPFMRPLVLHYPADARTIGLRDQFLWGRDILVAPVVTPDTADRQVYLPEGIWYDFWTNRRIKGGRFVKAQAPLHIMPMYVRAGAIIPMAPDRASTGGAWEELTLAVYPAETATAFDLYEDDGESTAYQRGVYAITQFTCSPADGGLRIGIGASRGGYAGQAERRVYKLAVRMNRRPGSVTVEDGVVLTPRRSGESLERSATGWWYDQKARVLHVKLGPIGGDALIDIR